MEFIEHTVAWCRGEIFEGRLLALFGAVVVAVSLAFWRFGSTPSARALAVGISMSFNNQARIGTYQAAFAENPAAFVQSERARTEAFIKWYPYTMYTFSVITILGLAVYLWRPTPLGRALGLTSLVLGLAVLFLDHFSEERAAVYHSQIVQELEGRASPPSSVGRKTWP